MKKTISITAAVVVIAASAFIFSNARFNGSITAAITEVDPVAAELSKPKKTLRAFRSEQELKDYFRALEEKRKRDAQRRAPAKSAANAPSASPSFSADGVAAEAAKDSKEDDSVTNNQHAGVDEGGIVKVHGDHLVILRRGRLFTVKIGDNALKPVDAVDAFAPGVNPQSDWYDEMLVSGNTVVVVGYSYGRGGTEINLFDIGELGELDYRSTYHLRSNDYYSSRNYASRLIGSKLIFYTPMYLGYGGGDPMERFPAVRKWHKGATTNEFRRIIEPTNIYRAERPVESNYGMALHTVTVCDLASRDFSCTATATLGAPGRVFYVSPSSVYVWTTDWSYNYGESRKPKSSSLLYKMPLDGSAPSAVGVKNLAVSGPALFRRDAPLLRRGSHQHFPNRGSRLS